MPSITKGINRGSVTGVSVNRETGKVEITVHFTYEKPKFGKTGWDFTEIYTMSEWEEFCKSSGIHLMDTQAWVGVSIKREWEKSEDGSYNNGDLEFGGDPVPTPNFDPSLAAKPAGRSIPNSTRSYETLIQPSVSQSPNISPEMGELLNRYCMPVPDTITWYVSSGKKVIKKVEPIATAVCPYCYGSGMVYTGGMEQHECLHPACINLAMDAYIKQASAKTGSLRGPARIRKSYCWCRMDPDSAYYKAWAHNHSNRQFLTEIVQKRKHVFIERSLKAYKNHKNKEGEVVSQTYTQVRNIIWDCDEESFLKMARFRCFLNIRDFLCGKALVISFQDYLSAVSAADWNDNALNMYKYIFLYKPTVSTSAKVYNLVANFAESRASRGMMLWVCLPGFTERQHQGVYDNFVDLVKNNDYILRPIMAGSLEGISNIL